MPWYRRKAASLEPHGSVEIDEEGQTSPADGTYDYGDGEGPDNPLADASFQTDGDDDDVPPPPPPPSDDEETEALDKAGGGGGGRFSGNKKKIAIGAGAVGVTVLALGLGLGLGRKKDNEGPPPPAGGADMSTGGGGVGAEDAAGGEGATTTAATEAAGLIGEAEDGSEIITMSTTAWEEAYTEATMPAAKTEAAAVDDPAAEETVSRFSPSSRCCPPEVTSTGLPGSGGGGVDAAKPVISRRASRSLRC
ncbi:hypothetical protein ACHAWF_003598 [Thalassiosira exigua]